jgi:hypothetical protein
MSNKLTLNLRLRLIVVIAFSVLLVIGVALTVTFGMRMAYVAMGIFAGITLAALYLLPMSIIYYVDGRIIALIVRETGGVMPQDISAIAEAVGMTEAGVKKYIETALKGGYLQSAQDVPQE